MFRQVSLLFTPRHQHRWVSLGGWCGPSQILAKNGLTSPETQLPFDLVRCTLDGVAHFTKIGFANSSGEYFPPRVQHESSSPISFFKPDPVSIWLLFRGWHTAFTHYDLNRRDNQEVLLSRMAAWDRLFRETPDDCEITFLRTSISEDPLAEMRFVPQLQKVFDEVSNNRLKFRIVLVHHLTDADTSSSSSIPAQTMPISIINDRAVMWQLCHSSTSSSKTRSLFDKSEPGYNTIISFEENFHAGKMEYDAEEIGNRSKQILPRLSKSSLLSRVEGVPTFRGTCTGFGSTQSQALNGICLSCGDRTGHSLENQEMFDTKRPWSADDDTRMLEMVLLLQDPNHGDLLDIVALVEKTANDLGRG